VDLRVIGREGSCACGEFGVGAVSARCGLGAKCGQAQGIPTHTTANWRRGQHTQLENTNMQVKEGKTRAQCEAPLRCRQCEQHASRPPACHTGVRPQAIQRSQHDCTCKRIPIQIQRAKPNPHHARVPHQPRAPEVQCSQA